MKRAVGVRRTIIEKLIHCSSEGSVRGLYGLLKGSKRFKNIKEFLLAS